MQRSRTARTAAVVLTILMSTNSAQAFDKCHLNVAARGDRKPSMDQAMASARTHWRSEVGESHGRRFNDWWYSGDRSFDCSWDASGTRISCVANARPCAPVQW